MNPGLPTSIAAMLTLSARVRALDVPAGVAFASKTCDGGVSRHSTVDLGTILDHIAGMFEPHPDVAQELQALCTR